MVENSRKGCRSLHANPFKESDGWDVPGIRDAFDVSHGCILEQELDGLADGFCSESPPLSLRA